MWNIFYSFDFILNGFMVLDTVNVSIKDDASIYVIQSPALLMIVISCYSFFFMEYIVSIM
jgi:hypothetical protein